MLQCLVCSPIPKVSEKKWATGQSFNWKKNTTYRIATLMNFEILSILEAIFKQQVKNHDMDECSPLNKV